MFILFSNWSKTWQLNVATHKYVVLSIGKIAPRKYILNDALQPTVENIKDLGVSFSNTLSFIYTQRVVNIIVLLISFLQYSQLYLH